MPRLLTGNLDNLICPKCGASLSYKPGTTILVCEHCDPTFENKTDAAGIAVAQTEAADTAGAQKENDLSTALASGWPAATSQMQAFVVKCPACNTQIAMEKDWFSAECPFCGMALASEPAECSVAQPQAFLPFTLEKDTAINWFYRWLRKSWLVPSDLKKSVNYDHFYGVYLPYWTFDADTTTEYVGEKGDRWGKAITWSERSGRNNHAFKDVLATASQALPKNLLADLEPWDLDRLVPYDKNYLSGFITEVSQVNIATGFEDAKQVIKNQIEEDIRKQIGGDAQRINEMSTNYDHTTYKYIFLPIWLNVYRYKDKFYHFLVNARTGEMQGEQPYSAIKISLVVLTGLAAMVIIGVLLYLHSIGQI